AIRFVLLAVCLGVLSLIALFHSNWIYDRYVYTQLGELLGGQLVVSETVARPFYSYHLKDVSFSDKQGRKNTIKEISLRYNLLSLFSRTVEIESLRLNHARLSLTSFLKLASQDSVTQPQAKSGTFYPQPQIDLKVRQLTLDDILIDTPGDVFGLGENQTLSISRASISIDDFDLRTGGTVNSSMRFGLKDLDSHTTSIVDIKFKIGLTPSADAQSIKLIADFSIPRVVYQDETIELGSTSFRTDSTLVLDSSGISVEKLTLSASREDQKLLELSASGSFDFDQSSGHIALGLLKVPLQAFSILKYVAPQPEGSFIETKGDFTFSKQSSVVKDFSLSFVNAKGSLLGISANLSLHEEKLKGALKTNRIDILAVQELIAALLPPSKSSSRPSPESSFTISSLFPKMPWTLDLALSIEDLLYSDLVLSKFETPLTVTRNTAVLPKTKFLLNGAPASLELALNTENTKQPLKGQLEISNLDLYPIAHSLNATIKDDFSGSIEKLQLQLASDPATKHNTPVADLRVRLKDLVVPSYLQDVPPLNLLFLPVEALEYAIGSIGGALLPSALTDLATDVKSSVVETGRIKFSDAQVRVFIDRDSFSLQDTKFNGNVLPTFHFNGDIGFDESLDLTLGIEVLKIPVPLTVAGNLSVPLPNLVSFVPQLVKSLGLGLVNIGGMFVKEDANEFFDSKDGKSAVMDESIEATQ
ncbi:MAG: hypothetical protein KDD62_04005, partial [Bdellovibrionales bacterium]|nr:hypothetical protein [Bdellovibrionales bacterium]